MCVSGSSPLARGTPPRAFAKASAWRLIPARAGNTVAEWISRELWTAHPRSRGEHLVMVSTPALGLGSSPLARGTHAQEDIAIRAIIGSSPLARGTLMRLGSSSPAVRLIPARAGNTIALMRLTSWFAAHPRSRGEHDGEWVSDHGVSGSSPLARGTRVACELGVAGHRLIPARAGNTHRKTSPSAPSPAHPRSRGEHSIITFLPMLPTGSSPLARGTHLLT